MKPSRKRAPFPRPLSKARGFVARVSEGFFEVFGVDPVVGRTFLPEEDEPGNDDVVVLSYGLWRQSFGSDPAVVGETVTVDGRGRTVIGVMPPGFDILEKRELWTPLAIDRTKLDQNTVRAHSLTVVAQLKKGWTIEQAEAETTLAVQGLAEKYPEHIGERSAVIVVPLQDWLVSDVRPALLVLLSAVGFVLLIACTNVANLLLAKAEGRQKEIAIRAALGAGRLRIVRQLLTESVLMALAGGAAGLLLALWGVESLVAMVPGDLPRAGEIGVNGWVLGFTLLLSLATGIAFGLLPALQCVRSELHSTLKEGGNRTAASSGRGPVRSFLVVTQVALALVLLIGAGLMMRSFWRLLQVDSGIDSQNVLMLELALPESSYPRKHDVVSFYEQQLTRLRELPGVESVGAVSWLPFASFNVNWYIEVEGRPKDPEEDDRARLLDFALVSGDYFRSIGIPLIKGRLFRRSDEATTPGVILTETAATALFPDEEALGRRIRMENDPVWRTIVGVVADHKNRGLDRPTRPGMYLPHVELHTGSRWLVRDMGLVVRTEGDPMAAAGAVRSAVRSLDADLPIGRLQPMEEVMTGVVAQPRFTVLLLVLFGCVGLVLAAVGIYGVLSYAVAERTREIGIRMALGARAQDVFRMILGRGLLLVAVGLAAGLVAAYWMTRWMMSTLLFEVRATDPVTLVGVTLVLTGAALAAGFIPARRATRIDPTVALRYE